jgi:cell division protease FtsH
MSRGELTNKMTVLLGGRAAESIFFEDISTGASDDLAKATDIARSMVTRYGMNEEVGLVSLESERSAFLESPRELATGRREFSEETAREVDCAVRELVQEAFERARDLLDHHRDAVVEAAERLLEKETLTGDELPEILATPA